MKQIQKALTLKASSFYVALCHYYKRVIIVPLLCSLFLEIAFYFCTNIF